METETKIDGFQLLITGTYKPTRVFCSGKWSIRQHAEYERRELQDRLVALLSGAGLDFTLEVETKFTYDPAEGGKT